MLSEMYQKLYERQTERAMVYAEALGLLKGYLFVIENNPAEAEYYAKKALQEIVIYDNKLYKTNEDAKV